MLTFTDDKGTREFGAEEVKEVRDVLSNFESATREEGYAEIFFTEDKGDGGFEIIFRVFDNGDITITKFL